MCREVTINCLIASLKRRSLSELHNSLVQHQHGVVRYNITCIRFPLAFVNCQATAVLVCSLLVSIVLVGSHLFITGLRSTSGFLTVVIL